MKGIWHVEKYASAVLIRDLRQTWSNCEYKNSPVEQKWRMCTM